MADKSPPLRLTPEEKRLYGQLFRIADTEQLGVITGSVAVEFFKKSRLSPAILAEIWTIADTDNQGFLSQKTWSIALRLIAHAQQGEKPTPALASRPGPPFPVFEGVQVSMPAPPPQTPQAPSTPVMGNRVPLLGAGERERYRNMFANTGAQNGLLEGEQARTIFLRARLPNDVLGQVWALADTHNRGALDITEFTIAMHLIQSLMTNQITAVPTSLPPELISAAGIGSPPTNQFSQTGVRRTASVSSTGSGRLPPQLPPKIQQSPLTADVTGGSQASSAYEGWDITPQDKMQFDNWFKSIDTANKGYIDGNEAVTFFLNSKLPEELLAHIWDLADISKRGALTRDTFAVAMYLIRQKLSGKDLPQTLPASLIPPSMRQSIPLPPAQPPAVQQPKPSSAAQDLFGLDNAFGPSNSQEPVATPAPPFMSGMGSPVPRTLSPNVVPTQSPKPMSPVLSASLHRGFQPQSSFGKGITSHSAEEQSRSTPAQSFTPSLSTSQSQSFAPATASFGPLAPVQVPMTSGSVFGDGDLLGDTDPEISQKLTAETAELANLSNQIGSLNNATKDLQSNKARAETELANVSQQKRDIEARLKQIRSLYDAEVNSVKQVETQLSTVRGELQKNRQEVTILEASLHALQAQHNEQRTALQKDQSENQQLKTRIAAVGEEIKGLKETLEKVKRDARQQRGMVAINKKQLSTIEGERDKVQGEIDSEKRAMEGMAAEMAAPAAQVQRDVMSPVGRERSTGTNPFLRRNTGEAMSPPQTFSPPLQQTFSPPAFVPIQPFSPFHEGAFDHAFDNAFATNTHADSTPFPPTQKPEARTPQQQITRESTFDQTTPPSIASALSPPLVARDFPYAESASSSLAVNPSRSGMRSVNGDASPSRMSDETPRKSTDAPNATGVMDTIEHHHDSAPRDGPVESNVEEKEVKSHDETTATSYPEPIHVDTHVTDLQPHQEQQQQEYHGARSAGEITSPDLVQETLSRPPHDKDLEIPPSPEQTARDLQKSKEPAEPAESAESAETAEPAVKEEEEENKGVALAGGFPSESSDEGRESWVDLGDESKSLPSEQHPPETSTTSSLPTNRSDPFAFESSSSYSVPKVATKEDFDAAFSGFGSLGKKDENGPFKRDFDSEFPPIEEFGGDESDSDDEPGGFGFNDNFAEKAKETGDSVNGTAGTGIAAAEKSVETPLQQTLPVGPVEPTKIPTPPAVVTPDPSAHLTDAPPPVPPKDAMPDESSAPPITPSITPPPETTEQPPGYSEYRNVAETSSGSNDLSGLLPQRGEPHASSAPYTSPPALAPAVFSAPQAFEPPKPLSFSPAPPAQEISTFTSTPSFFPSQSPLPPPAISTPQLPISQGTVIPSSSSTSFGAAPIEKAMKPTQTFGAFDFSGLQDAAPLDDSAEDPFRLSTRSDAFGEFDTTFDSNPVTPAKPTTTNPNDNTPHTNAKDFSDFGFDVPSDFGFPAQSQQQNNFTFTAAPVTTISSDFDDVFASFDKPVSFTPPALPARQPSPPDHPDLKTLTGKAPIPLSVHVLILEMGFPRGKAVEALEKHNYDLARVS